MHIPGHVLSSEISVAGWLVSLMAVTWSAGKFKSRADRKAQWPRFASTTFLLLASQAVNVPINSVCSAHFIGGVFAVTVLGVELGLLSIFSVLLIQALLFADGGLSSLGVNMFNVGLIAAAVTASLEYFCQRFEIKDVKLQHALLAAGAFVSMEAAALACSVELSLSKAIPFSDIAGRMLGYHAVLGVLEAGLTILGVSLYQASCRGNRKFELSWAMSFAACLLFIAAVPLSSQLPDTLEIFLK